MTLLEWTALVGVIASYWPNAKPTGLDVAKVQHDLVADIPFAEAAAAVKARARRGDTFAPNPGEIAADVLAVLNPATSWPDALRLLREACSRFSANDGPAAVAWLAERDRSVSGWVQDFGWYRWSMLPIDNEVNGHRIQQGAAESFAAHVERGRNANAVIGASGGTAGLIGGGS